MHKRTIWSKIFLLVCLCAFAVSVKAQTSDDAPGVRNMQGDAADAAKQLTDHDPLVRQRGAEELARLAATDWLHLVEGYRLQEKNARVRLALDWALYRMGKDEALYAVVRALDTGRAEQAAGYLASLETPEPLYAVLPQVNGNTQARLISVLGRSGDAATLEFQKFGLDRTGNGGDDFVLQLEQVSAAAVISFRPQVRVDVGIDQLGSDADVIPRPSHAAFQHIPHTELTTDLLRADRPVAVRERSMA